MENKGKFIVFEGTDGSGKSTQMKLLGKYLSEKGVECYLTHEPTDSPFGALLRSCMSGRIDADEHAIAALFAADRLDHIQNPVNGIKSKLDAGVSVLCDRFYFSSFAYNGGFVPLDWVVELNKPAMDMLRPDLVVYIDLPPEESMKRVSRRGATERYETVEKQNAIRAKFFEIFERFREENVAIVKSEEDKFATQANIRKLCARLWGESWNGN
jgi:dTMP kinase